MTKFSRNVLPEDKSKQVAALLQGRLVDAIDFALQLKQAHWCVVGSNFRAVHLQLDEILIDVRAASDEIAERISTLGIVPDGRAGTLPEQSQLKPMEAEFLGATPTVTVIADRLKQLLSGLRDAIGEAGDLDPVSEDLLIGIAAPLEKHLWMLQSQEM